MDRSGDFWSSASAVRSVTRSLKGGGKGKRRYSTNVWTCKPEPEITMLRPAGPISATESEKAAGGQRFPSANDGQTLGIC